MEFDYQQSSMVGGVLSFPNFPFGVLPTQTSAIKETISIGGQYSTSISITGSVDDDEHD